MIRVLLVDDHTAVRQALAFYFSQTHDIMITGQAGTLAEAQTMLNDIDVAVVDLGLPDGDGVLLIRRLRDANPAAAIVVLTGSHERAVHARAVEAGAAGVLHKSTQAAAIVDAVRRIHTGEFLLSLREIVELMQLASHERERSREVDSAFACLTRREREVLNYLAQGLNDKDIASRLQISPETQRTHVVNLLGKLGVHSRLQAVVMAVRHGVTTIT